MSLRCGWCITGHHGREIVPSAAYRGCPCGCHMTVRPRRGLLSPEEIAKHPWAFSCDVKGCYYGVCADTELDADRERYTHRCPRTGVSMGTSLLDRAWERLDQEVDSITATADPYQITNAKQRCRGMAEVIALIDPVFTTADAVGQRAGIRLAARRAS